MTRRIIYLLCAAQIALYGTGGLRALHNHFHHPEASRHSEVTGCALSHIGHSSGGSACGRHAPVGQRIHAASPSGDVHKGRCGTCELFSYGLDGIPSEVLFPAGVSIETAAPCCGVSAWPRPQRLRANPRAPPLA